MEIKVAILDNEKKEVKSFLNKFNLSYDKDINYTLFASENDKVVGTISVSNYIIKAFAVKQGYQGLASKLISELINYLYHQGIHYYQVYTSLENKNLFEAFNFKEIISTSNLCLMEFRTHNIVDELEKIKAKYQIKGNDIGCIVMNCNPFTLGHQYIINHAASKHQLLIVFILEEDRSFFKFADRIRLVKEGTAHLDNVLVIPSTKYLVSALTFPTYFLKEDVDVVREEALCDALIFKKYFIPIFNISRRYLGTETDLVTNKYNQVLKEVLGEKVEVIERIQENSENISASRVRTLLENNEFEKIERLVPKTTLEFLNNL